MYCTYSTTRFWRPLRSHHFFLRANLHYINVFKCGPLDPKDSHTFCSQAEHQVPGSSSAKQAFHLLVAPSQVPSQPSALPDLCLAPQGGTFFSNTCFNDHLQTFLSRKFLPKRRKKGKKIPVLQFQTVGEHLHICFQVSLKWMRLKIISLWRRVVLN